MASSALLLPAFVAACLSQGVLSADQETLSLLVPGRVAALNVWLTVVEAHKPGEPDASVQRLSAWNSSALNEVWVDVHSLVRIIRGPETKDFWTPARTGSSRSPRSRQTIRSVPIDYSRDELEGLRTVAKVVEQRGGIDRVLKRGAMLHADVAVLGRPPQGTARLEEEGRPRCGRRMPRRGAESRR